MSSEDIGQDVSQAQAESVNAPATEKMLPQSKVTELVANARLVAEQKARQEMEAKFSQEREQMMQQRSMGGMAQPAQNQGFSQEDAAKLVEAEIAKRDQLLMQQQQRAQVEELANQYTEKMAYGENAYDDFKEVTGKFNPVKFPQVTLAAATLDNTADVIYDIMQNPTKLTHLQQLFQMDENLAFDEMKRLSASIKRNSEAAESNVRSPNPLSKPKPSIAGADSGRKTIADWKKRWKA